MTSIAFSRLLLAVAVFHAALVVAAKPKWYEVSESYSFEQYKRDFGKQYASHSEHAARRDIFLANLRTIVKHNKAQPTPTWFMGVNHFTDLTSEEFKARLGYNNALGRHYRATHTPVLRRAAANVKSVADVPASVDWRDKGIVTPVKNQGNCGSCYAFGSTENIESYLAKNTGTVVTLSPEQVVRCSPNPNDCGGTGGCGGSIPELVFDYIESAGMTSEWKMSYTSYDGDVAACDYKNSSAVVSISGYKKLPSNQYLPVLEALANEGPLAINVQAMPWQHYDSGVFTGCSNLTNVDIDHVVQLVGYGKDASTGQQFYLIRNSWSPMWGEKGYIRVLRNDKPVCGTDSTPQDGTGCSGGPSKVTVCGTCGILYDTSYPTGVRLS